MMRTRVILMASSVLLLAMAAGTTHAQEARRGDDQPRARQTETDRPIRQSEADRPRDGGGPRSERVVPADRPGPDIERLKTFLDNNPEARRELMQYLRQQAQQDQVRPQRAEREPLPGRAPNRDLREQRPMQPGQGWGRQDDRPQFDPQRAREFLRDNPEARQRLRELVEQRPELRGRVGEFLQEHPDAIRRLMQQQQSDRMRPQAEPRPLRPRAQERPGLRPLRDQQLPPRLDPQHFRDFLQAHPRIHERFREFMQQGMQDRGVRPQGPPAGPGSRFDRPQRGFAEGLMCPHCRQPVGPQWREQAGPQRPLNRADRPGAQRGWGEGRFAPRYGPQREFDGRPGRAQPRGR